MPSSHMAFRSSIPPIEVFPINDREKILNTQLNSYWRYITSSNLFYSAATGLLELKK
jgi:hypothetical protein